MKAGRKRRGRHLPNVHLLRNGLVANDLRSHPGHRTRERHLGALVTELFGRPEIRDLHGIVVGDQHAGIEKGKNRFAFRSKIKKTL